MGSYTGNATKQTICRIGFYAGSVCFFVFFYTGNAARQAICRMGFYTGNAAKNTTCLMLLLHSAYDFPTLG